MAEQDTPFGAETYNYAAGERPPGAAPTVAASVPTPVPTPTPAATPYVRPRETIEQSLDRYRQQLEERKAATFLERSKKLQERAQTGLTNLVGETPPEPSTPVNPNILAARTGTLDTVVNAAQTQNAAAQALPKPTLEPIKPGAQLNSVFAPKFNPTPAPATISTGDKRPTFLDARFANKEVQQ